MNFIEEFEARGFFHQCTDKENLIKKMNSEVITAYIGFDCTAPSLHVGSLMQIMILRLLQKHGHRPLVILGGGTTKIGDPSLKDEARKLLDDEAINLNLLGIKDVLSKYINFGTGKSEAIIVNNAEWLDKLNYLEFLRDYGKHFSVNRMLSFDSVKLRLEREQNLSFLEFNYMLLQAYDFVELFDRHNCLLQIGGSDQWGNIVNGIDLGRRLGKAETLFGLTTPLITTSSGLKMGKSMSGAVWLSDNLLSAYDFYQYWRNVEDADVARFLKLYTDLSLAEIAKLALLKDQEINEAKKILAYEVTKLCHGETQAQNAAESALKLFSGGELGEHMPSVDIAHEKLISGINLYNLLVIAGLSQTGGEAKRLITGGGAKVNDQVILDPMAIINESYIMEEKIKLSAGKKKHVAIKVK
jgi:tyrosyl-tRNA synthetase